MSDPAVLVQLVVTALYAGFQATVRVVVYPQMALVAAADFPVYEAAHQRRVSMVVGPLFAGLLVATVLLVLDGGVPRVGVVLSGLLLMALLAVTAFAAAPLHGRLSSGFDPALHARLLRWDAVRLVIAVADGVLAVWLAVRR